VLIHAGAGGVGLAAIQLGHLVGAEIWATAGTAEKREYLHSMGIEHVLDSRTLTFADEIKALTNGEGVDVILNSLAGEAITKGLAILRPYGRFLEIGKRDIYDNSRLGLQPFQKNLSYFAIDLDRMTRERPAVIGQMLREIMLMLEAGEIQPIPYTPFSVSQLADAFRYMAQGKHTGKVVVQIHGESARVQMPLVRTDGTYLVTGGLGGLGLTVARWLAAQGAGQLVLAGRNQPTPSAQTTIRELEAMGTYITVAQVDVAEAQAVAQLIAHIQESDSPLRGVIHAAGVLDDALTVNMNTEKFQHATRPKINGAWNLHKATLDCPLDFFVMFSSVASVLGTAGQGNYAAGNAFMDALAASRRTQGLPALSINWGPWSEVGLAAAQANRGERLASRGLNSLSPEDGMRIFEQVIQSDSPQLIAMAFDAVQWAQTYPAAAQASLLAELISQPDDGAATTTSSNDDLRTLLLAAEPGKTRRNLLETHVRQQVAQVLGLAVNRIDVHKPLRNMGIDSLMTLELRNRLESGTGLKLPATLIFNYPTVTALTGNLAEKMGIPLEATAENGVETSRQENTQSPDQYADLTRDEVESLLAEELRSLDDLLN
jgi:NADPH:quinone reductase-like Zn-dependent oxidoreductase/acyl carrier protein